MLDVAQLVELRIAIPVVAGSSPFFPETESAQFTQLRGDNFEHSTGTLAPLQRLRECDVGGRRSLPLSASFFFKTDEEVSPVYGAIRAYIYPSLA